MLALLLPACADDDLFMPSEPEEPAFEEFKGFSVNFAVTLDNMGGGSRAEDDPQFEIENYINPEKFRVLFFDHEDKFLFESKSRYVKKLGGANEYSEWFVSVPFYDYGNDIAEKWNWKKIREAVTSNEFKIAILANRPEWECYPDMTKLSDRTDENVSKKSKKFDNSGPFWGEKDRGIATIYDLHHCQWDPIYTEKGRRKDGNLEGYYQFIMKSDPENNTYDNGWMMGAVSCWVDCGKDLEDSGIKFGSNRRRAKMPTQDYPIPMYGLQKFQKIENWVEGTPFNLSNITNTDLKDRTYKTIALLRSVVKLELLVPKSYGKPSHVSVRYTNVYARCEPMNVWDPTDEIWKDHDNGCEWTNIMNYGGWARSGDPASNGFTSASGQAKDTDIVYKDGWDKTGTNGERESFIQYRNRLSWLYGSWVKKGFWTMPGDVTLAGETNPKTGKSCPYPQVFNPCIQRNQVIWFDPNPESDAYQCDLTSKYPATDPYYHYVVYLGERNVSDPSDLYNIGNMGSGKPVVGYWYLQLKNKSGTMYYYSLPFLDYDKYPTASLSNLYSSDSAKNTEGSTLGGTNGFEESLAKDWNNQNIMPWPLIRNHVYTFTLATAKSGELFPVVQDRASKTIKFK